MSLLFPALLAGQNPDPRIAQVAPEPGVRSVKITTVRYYSGFKDHHESKGFHDNKFDTTYGIPTLDQKKYYSEEGRLDSAYYNHHTAQFFYYGYMNDTSWTCISAYGKDRFDRTVVNGNSAEVFYYYAPFASNKFWYSGDSLHSRSYDKKGKLEKIFSYDRCSSASDSFWDYQSCGLFARKTVVHSMNRDTISYLDKKNRWMVKVINHFDSAGHPVKTEYMNRSMKEFDLIPMHANPHVGDATLYLPQNGTKVSMTVNRTYNGRGLLIEESWQPAESSYATYMRYYQYAFW